MKLILFFKSILLLGILMISSSSCTLFENEQATQVEQVEQGPIRILMDAGTALPNVVCSLVYDDNGYVTEGSIREVGGNEVLTSIERTSSTTMAIGPPDDLLTFSMNGNRITGYDNGDTKLSIEYDSDKNITEVLKQNHHDSGLSNVLIHQFSYGAYNQVTGIQGIHHLSDSSLSVSPSSIDFSSYSNPIYEIRDLWVTEIASYIHHDISALAFSPLLYTEMRTTWATPDQELKITSIEDIEVENGRVVKFKSPGIFGLTITYTFEYE